MSTVTFMCVLRVSTMTEGIRSDIYSSFHSIYRLIKHLGILTFSFNSNKRRYVVTKKDILRNVIFIFSVIVLQIGLLVVEILKNSTPEILSDINGTICLSLSLLNFYFHKTTIIKIFYKISHFDSEVNYNHKHNSKICLYKICIAVTLILYLIIDISEFVKYVTGPLFLINSAMFYCEYFIRSSMSLMFVFLLTELENRFIFSTLNSLYTSKGFAQLSEICKLINTVYHVPLILQFARILFSILRSLSFIFLQVGFSDSFSYDLTLVLWFSVEVFEAVIITILAENFYKNVR
jgi:hypothetical protein